jgi:predicted DNA-binding protein with PD1-like motif
MGCVAYARIAPNEDLVRGIEKINLAEGFWHAFVPGALPRHVDADLGRRDGKDLQIKGAAAEIVSLAGEVRANADGSMRASLSGVIAGPDGHVCGGPFVAGSNPVRMTFDVTREEPLPKAMAMAASC